MREREFKSEIGNESKCVCACIIGCVIGVFQSTGYKDQVMISGFAVFGLELGYRVFCVWGIVCVCVCECVCGVCVYTIGVVCVCVYHWGSVFVCVT